MEVLFWIFFYLETYSLCALVQLIEHLVVRENVSVDRYPATLRLYLAELCYVRCPLILCNLDIILKLFNYHENGRNKCGKKKEQ